MNRRTFLKALGLLATTALLGCDGEVGEPLVAPTGRFIMPDEGAPHVRTWMGFGASRAIWGRRLLPAVQQNLATIANTIAKYEPVTMLVRENELATAQALVSDAVELQIAPLDDLWLRDTGPTFVFDADNQPHAIDFNFNGWGEKQTHALDAQVATLIANTTQIPIINTLLVLEGGCFEVDGHGSAIITESCVLNDNRNPDVAKAEFEALFMPLLGLEKIIWLPGIRGMDITDGHTDFYARFVEPGVVVAAYDPDPLSFDHEVTLRHLDLLQAATDANGNLLDVVVLEGPQTIRETYANDEFAAGYVGYYLCNGAVIMPEFGDPVADGAAYDTIRDLFPDRTVERLNIDGLAAGGGSIHCATQQQPRG